jgi:hypothetical protein
MLLEQGGGGLLDDEIRALLADMSMSQAGHLPVVAAFLRRIGLAGVHPEHLERAQQVLSIPSNAGQSMI